MRFLIGYPVASAGGMLVDLAISHGEQVVEVYFSWPGIPSGRGAGRGAGTGEALGAVQRLLEDLRRLRNAGIELNFLLNGNCYGHRSQARSFFEKIGETVDFLVEEYSLASITTSSPLIAKFLKQNFPSLERRASVNMEIGTVEGMDYLAEFFDSYYLRRELNRSLDAIQKLRAWCDSNGKKLYALANSGCLNYCSAHNFHDNLVAHEHEISEMDNAYEFDGICKLWLANSEKRRNLLEVSNFIRPEDVQLYEGLFDGMKLATRVSRNPVSVVGAYLAGHFQGNLLDLLEPDHAESFYPEIVENSRLPEDFGERTMRCGHDCKRCAYCREALVGALVNLNDWSALHAGGY